MKRYRNPHYGTRLHYNITRFYTILPALPPQVSAMTLNYSSVKIHRSPGWRKTTLPPLLAHTVPHDVTLHGLQTSSILQWSYNTLSSPFCEYAKVQNDINLYFPRSYAIDRPADHETTTALYSHTPMRQFAMTINYGSTFTRDVPSGPPRPRTVLFCIARQESVISISSAPRSLCFSCTSATFASNNPSPRWCYRHLHLPAMPIQSACLPAHLLDKPIGITDAFLVLHNG